MSFLANFLMGTPKSHEAELIREGVGDYFLYKDLDEVGHSLLGSGLDDEGKRLENEIKRRQLEQMGGRQESRNGPGSLLATLGIQWGRELQPPRVESRPGGLNFDADVKAGLQRALRNAFMDEGEIGKGVPNVIGSSIRRVSRGSPNRWSRLAANLF